MASHGAQGDKRRKRAVEDLRRGLARGDVVLACEGLAALGDDAGDDAARRVVERLAAEVVRARTAGDWGRIARLGKPAEGVWRWLDRLGAERSADVRWALAWGCGLGGQWARARSFWSSLEPEARVGAPELARAVETWMATEGTPALSPELRARLAPAAPVVRSDVEPVGRSASQPPPPPHGPDDLEPALVAARAALAWPDFEAWVAPLLRGPLADRACEAVGALALREMLVRLEQGQSLWAAPLGLLGRCAEALDHADALLALRLGLRAAMQGATTGTENAALRPLVRRLANDTAARDLVRDTLEGCAADASTSRVGIEALATAAESLVQVWPTARVWSLAASLFWARHRAERRRGEARHADVREEMPPFMIAALERVLTSDVEGLAAWLRAAPHPARAPVLALVGSRAAPNRSVDLVLALAPLACSGDDGSLLADLSDFVAALLAHASPIPCIECGVVHASDLVDWDALSADARGLWQRLEPAVLPLSIDMLDLALDAHRASTSAQRDVLERYVAAARSPQAWVDAIELAVERRLKRVPATLCEQLTRRFAGDAGALAAAYEAAEQASFAPGLLRAIGGALAAAIGASVASTPQVRAVGQRAARLLAAERRREERRRQRAAQGALFKGGPHGS